MSNSLYEQFQSERCENVNALGGSHELSELVHNFHIKSAPLKYTYNFDWLGRPIIQFPQDIVAMQELIWKIRPDLIIETGIAHGGSLIFSASMLALLDMSDAIEANKLYNPKESKRKVLGIDIDIREHNRKAIDAHVMASRIQMIQGSSVAPEIISHVHEIASTYSRILVCLDSHHAHEHVLAELGAYAPLVSVGSYCVVFDTIIEQMPDEISGNRPWGSGNNPHTAVCEYLKVHNEFQIDKSIQHKLLITVAPDGYLKRIS